MAVFGEVQPHVVRPEVVDHKGNSHHLVVEKNEHYGNIVLMYN